MSQIFFRQLRFAVRQFFKNNASVSRTALRRSTGVFTPSSVPFLPDVGSSAPQLQPIREDPLRGYRPLSLRSRNELSTDESHAYHTVTPEWFGERIDTFMLQHYPQLERSAIIRLIEQGDVFRLRKNGKRRYTRITDRLELDDLVVVPKDHQKQLAANVEVMPKSARESHFHLSPQARALALEWVLFKNEHVVVINKPSGVPSQPTESMAMNLTDMLPAWKFTYSELPRICHHLDVDTSGCVVIARTAAAHRLIGRMFQRRVVPNDVYWSFLVGCPKSQHGRIRMHFEIERVAGGERIIARPTPTDKSRVGVAEFIVNADVGEFGSFVSFYPLTSRRHQLRIMAAHALRSPILGDSKFGGDHAFPQSLSLFWDPDNKGIPLHLHHRKIQLPYKKRQWYIYLRDGSAAKAYGKDLSENGLAL